MRGQLAPKDDIESLLYVLIYLIKGNLPWAKNIPVLDQELQAQLEVQNVVAMRHPGTLCENMDSEFIDMLKFVHKK